MSPPLLDFRVRARLTRKRLYLLTGFLIALMLAPWTEQRYDTYVFRLWPALILNYNMYPIGPQTPPEFPLVLGYGYPPIWLYISIPLFALWQSIARHPFPSEPSALWIHGVNVNNLAESYRSFVPPALPFLDMLFKLPNILASVGIAYLLMKNHDDEKRQREIFFLWLLNPYVLLIVAVWGSFDAIVTFFAFCAMYFLRTNRKSISAVMLSLGFCTKLYPILFLIPTMVFLLKRDGLKQSLKYLAFFLLATGIVFGVFALLFPNGLDYSYRLLIGRASPDMYGNTFISGMTWFTVLNVAQWSGSFPIFPVVFIPAYFTVLYLLWRRQTNINMVYTSCVTILFLFYISYTIVYPQYFLWVLPFLVFFTLKSSIPRKFCYLISAIPLVWVFVHYNTLYFISPTIIWNEADYPPFSYILEQLRHIQYVTLAETFLAVLISASIAYLLVTMVKKQIDKMKI